MKREDIHRNLMAALEKKFPERTHLVEKLMGILFMEKGAIYRRLRGDVPFSFYEVVMIADKLELSFHNLIYTDSMQTDRFELNILDYANMHETDYKTWEDYIALFGMAKNDPRSKYAQSSNALPLSVYARYDSLSKYFLFKYLYLLSEKGSRILYSTTVLTERLRRIFQSYHDKLKIFNKTIYVWDYLIFRYLVTDIKFFSSINLIFADEIKQIKEDLFDLVDYIEQIAIQGCFKETGTPVSFYISDVNLDADYRYLQINDLRISHVRTFILNTVVSTNPAAFEKLRQWIHSLKKSSTLITQSGTVYRVDFFERQRKIISEL